jgi:hypothetical protein
MAGMPHVSPPFLNKERTETQQPFYDIQLPACIKQRLQQKLLAIVDDGAGVFPVA